MFALVTSGISIYSKIQINGKASHTEPDINENSHTQAKLEEKSLYQRTFQCFDVMDNYNRLFQMSSPNNFLSTIAGMRLVDLYMFSLLMKVIKRTLKYILEQ